MEITSFCFTDENNNILSSKSENVNITPASNLKIITGFTVYKILGKNFEFSTNFDTENNSFFISGDPTPLLNFYDILAISNAINSSCKIKNVYFTDIYDDEFYASSWPVGDLKFCYASKIEPYTVNEGCIPENFDYKSLEFSNPHSNNMRPCSSNKELFAEFLIFHLNHKTGNGNIKHYVYRNSILNILEHIETLSCNFSIDVVLKYLSYKRYGRGTWDKSIEIVNNFIKLFYGNIDNIRIVDGSGLSRTNLTNTLFISSFINKIFKNDAGFLSLLPVPGKGTLMHRLKNSNYTIHAKTGTLTGCSLLSGFIEENKISFSIAINNSLENKAINEGKIDKLLLNELNKIS